MLKLFIACASGVSLSLLATFGFAQNQPLVHQDDWPISNWHDHQPTQDELNALHRRDVTPNEAQEVDRLYNQLESGSTGVDRQQTSGNDVKNDDASDEGGLAKEINKENRRLDQELKGICRGC